MLEARNVRGERQPYLPSWRWVDGSVADDLPTKRLSRLYGVNHYIASQTNPVVLWFIRDPKARQSLLSTGVTAVFRTYQEVLRATQPLTQKMIRRLPRAELLYNMFYSVATQKYTGDITIIPRSRVFNPTRLLSPVTEKELMEFIIEGERATYPKIEMIRNCQKISLTLERILTDYDRRAIRNAHKLTSPRLVRSSGGSQSAA
jgi:NTE family protein